MTQLSALLNSINRNDWSTRKIDDEAAKLGHNLHFTTASRYLKGKHPTKPSAEVLAAFAAVFNVDVNDLREVAGQGPVSERFELPPEADMLDPDERQAVVNLVRVMARKKGQEDDRQGEEEPGTEARSKEHSSTDSSEDGSEARRTGAAIRPHYGLAADIGASEGVTQAERADALGEESQDHGDHHEP